MNSASAPDLTVIMATKGHARHVGEAIESVRKQSCRNWQMIVIHDGADADSLAVLQAQARADARIRLEPERASGFAHAINQGLAQADTPFVAFQESDDVSHPERFALCLDMMRRHRRADVIVPYWVIFDAQSHLPIEQFRPGFIMSCFRTASLKRMGPFRPFFVSMADVDMKWRMDDDKEICVRIVPHLLYFKRHHAEPGAHLYLRGNLSLERLAMCTSRWCRQQGKQDALAWNFTRADLLQAVRGLPPAVQAHLCRETIRQTKKHLSFAYEYAFSPQVAQRILSNLRAALEPWGWSQRRMGWALLRLRLSAFLSCRMRRVREPLRRLRKPGWRLPALPIAAYMNKAPWNMDAHRFHGRAS